MICMFINDIKMVKVCHINKHGRHIRIFKDLSNHQNLFQYLNINGRIYQLTDANGGKATHVTGIVNLALLLIGNYLKKVNKDMM